MSQYEETIPSFRFSHRYALCVGIGEYSKLQNHDLRFAISDARAVAEVLSDPQRGNFDKVSLKITPEETTGIELRKLLINTLNDPVLSPNDLVVIYISCHGDLFSDSKTFCLLASDAEWQENGTLNKLTVLTGHDLTNALDDVRVKNVIIFLDACHSGGAGKVFQRLPLNLDLGPNIFIIGAARQGQKADQSGKLKHSVFTYCLLQALEQKPTRSDSWITVSQIHNFIADNIQRYGVAPIQSQSASVNPNLPLVQNPQYSPESHEFNKLVRELLQMTGYKPMNTPPPDGAPARFYVAKLKAGADSDKVGIITYYDKVQPLTPEYVEELVAFIKEQIEERELDKALLITLNEPSREVKRVIRNSSIRYPTLKTYNELQHTLIDFDDYMHKLVEEYIEPEPVPDRVNDPALAQVYIPLKCKVPWEDRQGILREFYGDLEDIVTHWLADPRNPRVVLLADYGSGKTAFCRHLAAKLAEKYLNSDEHTRYHCRIPLLISLGDFAKYSGNLEGYLIAYLKQKCEVENPNYRALLKMAEAGLILFIFDGFDEMAVRADSDTIQQNIAMIEGVARIPHSKVLLTTRPEYFVSQREAQEILTNYQQIELQPFNEEQVDEYLKKRVPLLKLRRGERRREWTYYRDRIKEIYNLSELERKPVLLEMVVKVLPQLTLNTERINRSNLYQYYLENELRRQTIEKRRNLLIKREKRFEIMERLAMEIYWSDSQVLTIARINDLSKHLLTPDQQSEMAYFEREILACSFLNRQGDYYHFSHESFLEYLIARCLARELSAGKLDNLRQKPLSKTIREFIVGLDQSANLKPSINAPLINEEVFLDTRNLVGWLFGNPKDRWVTSNIASLLAGLTPRHSFVNHNLAGADLCKACLSMADLSKAILNGADLSGTDLSGAILMETKLKMANLVEANLRDANLYGADLSGADLTGADLSGATLSNARLNGAKLNGAKLNGAKMIETDVREADLTVADMNGADLRHARNLPYYMHRMLKQVGVLL